MILVLSDTHIPDRMPQPPKRVLVRIKSAKVIFHAGDFVRWEVLEKLEGLATVHAVRGKMDEARIRKILPEKKLVEVRGKKIGLCHGSGSSQELSNRVYRGFGQKYDLLIFGHSHPPFNKKIDRTLIFNPKSLYRNLLPPFSATYGVLTVEGNKVWAKVFELE